MIQLKAGFYQYDIKNSTKAANLAKIRATLTKEDFDLLVLPELSASGYLYASPEEARKNAEAVPLGITTMTIEKIALEKKAYIVAGVLEIGEDNRLYNTAVLTGPNGYMGKYRKIHLSSLETKLFTKGSELYLFDIGLCKIGIIICFDLWYPETCRELMFLGADLICCPSNFGGHWSVDFAKIRALENLTYIITCNRVGAESMSNCKAHFCGNSQILNYDGQAFYQAGANEELKIWQLEIEEKKQRDFILAPDIDRDIQMYKHHYKL